MIKFNLYEEGGLKVHFLKKNEKAEGEFNKFLEDKKFIGKLNEMILIFLLVLEKTKLVLKILEIFSLNLEIS